MTFTASIDISTLREAIDQSWSLNDVRDLLSDWILEGVTQDDLRNALRGLRADLQANGLESEEDRLLEVLDIVEGWCSPHLRLPFPSGNIAETESSLLVKEGWVATVLLPSAGEFQKIRDDLVVPALHELGFEVTSIVTTFEAEGAIHHIVSQIGKSQLVVIDATGLDSLPMYLLGISQALRRATLVLTQDVEELPFDLRAYDVVPYSTRLDEIGKLKAQITEAAKSLMEHPGGHLGGPVGSLDLRTPRDVSLEPEDDEDEDDRPGLLDLLPAAMEAMETIGAVTESIGSLTSNLGTEVANQSREIERHKAQGGPGVIAKTRRAMKVVTAHVDDYADHMDGLLPGYVEQWSSFASSTIDWLSMIDISDGEDREAAARFIEVMSTLKENVEGSASGIGEFRDAIAQLRKRRLSKELNPSLRRVERLLNELIETLLTGSSQLGRIGQIVSARLDAMTASDVANAFREA
jgi:hypothetical protein